MLPDKNWLCQQTFETAYMEIPFDIHKRIVPRSLLQHIEKEINNSNTPIEKLYEQLQSYIYYSRAGEREIDAFQLLACLGLFILNILTVACSAVYIIKNPPRRQNP